MSIRQDIIDGMARTLWLNAYADYADQNPDADIDRAGGGQDWDDVAPETPPAAIKAAKDLTALIEETTRDDRDPSSAADRIEDLFSEAKDADSKYGKKHRRLHAATDDDAEDFGSSLAFQALGTGVSWFDDHATFSLKVPSFECWYDGENLEWSGGNISKNPASLSSKGERMYEHIKSGYGKSPRAKEIAARTVLSRSHEHPELVRHNPSGDDENWSSNWRAEYDRKNVERYAAHAAQHGRDWGYDGEWAFLREQEVREALAASSQEIAAVLKKDPLAVCSSYSPIGKATGWADADWRRVLIFTESGIGDPFHYKVVHAAFDKAVKQLNKLENGDQAWMWDSINAAVMVFRLTPEDGAGKVKRRNPWDVSSDTGVRESFADQDDAEFNAGELRQAGQQVTVQRRGARPAPFTGGVLVGSSGEPRQNPGDPKNEVGHTIFEQIGGNRAMMMIGGKATAYPDRLQVKYGGAGGKAFVVRLDPIDTYTVELWKGRSGYEKKVAEESDVYVDVLRDTIERMTGYRLSLGTMGR